MEQNKNEEEIIISPSCSGKQQYNDQNQTDRLSIGQLL